MNKQKNTHGQHDYRGIIIYGAFSIKEDSCPSEEVDGFDLGEVVFAEQDDQGNVEVRNINENFVPSGEKKFIPKEQFLNCYLPEPSMFNNKVLPALQELNATIEEGEKALQNNELFSAEHEFNNALCIDEKNIRATFNLGLTYLEMQDWDNTEQIFQKLIKMDAPFKKEQKHLFNKFGIELRKKGLHKHALKYYSKAVRLETEDEHLCFNIARVFHDKGNIRKCKRYLQKALQYNPDFKYAKSMLQYLQ